MERKPILVVDRETGTLFEEKVFGSSVLEFLYGDGKVSRWFGRPLAHLVSRYALFSHLYGWWQKRPATKKNIIPFIQTFGVDSSEFAVTPDEYNSFNDFFIRKLQPQARPIASADAVIPADGRFYFFQDASQAASFQIKGKTFDLRRLLNGRVSLENYERGALVIGRLCPVDYHRFHFPFSCLPDEACEIQGFLYSVNPIAVKKNLKIFCENKRFLTRCVSEQFGEVVYLEVGATHVGSVHQTFSPHQIAAKGTEKGYFSFGGSAVLLLFPERSIQFDQDLIAATESGHEVYCRMGQSMGKATS